VERSADELIVTASQAGVFSAERSEQASLVSKFHLPIRHTNWSCGLDRLAAVRYVLLKIENGQVEGASLGYELERQRCFYSKKLEIGSTRIRGRTPFYCSPGRLAPKHTGIERALSCRPARA